MMKLLIVDDSNVIRSRIDNIYAKSYEIEVVGKAVNGRQAVAMLKDLEPDIVTMDLTMPEMDGIASIKRFMELQPSVKILVVSALSDKATGIKALSKGARGFLCKPFTDEELTTALQKLIDAKNRE